MTSAHPTPPPITLREIAPTAFLPPAVYAVGQGAIAPVIVISAGHLGADPAQAALIVALAGLGQILADVPAGAIAARFGERAAMIGASLLCAAAMGACMWAPTLGVFAAGIFASGAGNAVWLLARQSYVTAIVPYQLRARAMSTLGGVNRIGFFVGPFIGSAVMHFTGPAGAYGVQVVAALLAAVVLLVVPEPDLTDRPAPPPPTASRQAAPVAGAPARVGAWQVLRDHAGAFATLGTGVLLISAVRASRQVVLPLWGVHLGLSPTTVSIIYGISGGVDMLLFYPAGRIMDRRGRAFVAVPSMVLLATAHLLMPLTDSAIALLAVGILLGIGNGTGSGLVMTLGADLAPTAQRPVFLGLWRLFADTGAGLGPLVVAGVTAVASLAAAIVTMGGVGFVGAAALGYWIPRRGSPRPHGPARPAP